MYKGKFSKPRNTALMDVEEQIPESQLTEESIIAEFNAEPQPVEEQPQASFQEPEEEVQKKRKPVGTIVFYSIYGGLTALLIIAIVALMFPLRQWLATYEASQPEKRSQEVYQELFAQPDWAALYEKAGLQDTAFEDKHQYAAYMEKKVADQELVFTETSAGLSGDHKYIVRLGAEKIGAFTLTGGTEEQTKLGNWQLGQVELYVERTQSVTVEKLPEHTVSINGVALDDSHTIKMVSTAAEEYMPEGLHGYRMQTQYVDGLLVKPVVSCTDENGAEVAMEQNEDGIYRPVLEQPAAITAEEETLAIDAAKTYALYAIRRISVLDVRKYYDTEGEAYQNMVNSEPFHRKSRAASIDNISVSDFYRYSDELFSVRVDLVLHVTLETYTVKDYDSSRTYFFSKMEDGSFKVTSVTNVAAQEPITQVRLDFVVDSENTQSIFVDSTARSVELPQVEPPADQVLVGWACKTVDEEGKPAMRLVITPGVGSDQGAVADEELEHMVLYPVYERVEN